ncbi:MAG: hypothetical protein KAI40_10235 [Desulfobacterales bacterium]|nr:hypothetical protein [Desulfobacterales bacterium]
MKIINKTKFKIKNLLCICLIFFTYGCISSNPVSYYNVAQNYTAAKINKVGILVVRMGNAFPYQTLPLTPDTDFSITTPQYGWHGKISEKTVNVYVEDEKRLKESFPYYPATSKGRLNFLTDHYTFEFYKNFSPQIYTLLSNIYTSKGYDTINIAELSQSWDKPVSESSISEILKKSKPTVDAVAIFQYMDIGNNSLRIGSAASKREGLFNFEYSLYMFDTISEEVILNYSKDFPAGVIIALLNDPEITENPDYKDKVKKFSKGYGRWETLYFVNKLPENINSDSLMNYIENGIEIHYKGYGDMKWTGLMEVIPEK